MEERQKILIVEDDESDGGKLERLLKKIYRVVWVKDEEEMREALRKIKFDLMLLDFVLDENEPENLRGLDLIPRLREQYPAMSIIAVTGINNIRNVLNALKLGARHFLYKEEYDKKYWLDTIKEVLKTAVLKKENQALRAALKSQKNTSQHKLIGESKAIRRIRARLKLIAQKNKTTLITGEMGTGKEVVAQLLGQNSNRKKFVPVHIAGLNPETLASELFGHVKGAFTGATTDKTGYFETANKGILFLDELGEINLEIQAKLLRVLQEKKVVRVGSTKQIDVDVRVIAATNRDLKEAVKQGLFRADLYSRLKVLVIDIPSLRERKEDIPLLLHFFLNKEKKRCDELQQLITPDAMQLLMTYDWEGNVRELSNTVESMLLEMELEEKEKIDVACLPDEIRNMNEMDIKNIENGIAEDLDLAPKEEMPYIRLKKIEHALINERNKKEAAIAVGYKGGDHLRSALKTLYKNHRDLFGENGENFPMIWKNYERTFSKIR